MIVIKGNMPKGTGCDGCGFQTSTYEQLDACTCYLFAGTIDNFHNERHKDCPIIGEIPDEHGRLIDADVFKGKVGLLDNFECQELVQVRRILDEAPTVIPASDGE